MPTTEVSDDRLLSRAETAWRLRLSGETISKYGRIGVLPAVETPYGKAYRASDVEQLRQERETKMKGETDG